MLDSHFDVLVVGSGIAGLSVALAASGLRVALVSHGSFGSDGSSSWAQGGIAAALGEDDSPQLHAEDTCSAGVGHCNAAAVSELVSGAPAVIAALQKLGVPFDVDAGGQLSLAREAAHSRARIIHARGDASGLAVMQVLAAAVRARPNIAIFEHCQVTRLDMRGAVVAGASLCDASGNAFSLSAAATVLATGGLGQLFRHTSNPPGLWGSGLGLALDCGAELADLEFVQFHPTALAVPGADAQLPLLTEALRGAGAQLVGANGQRLMAGIDPRLDLAPRDVVARAVWAQLQRGEQAFLDATRLSPSRLRKSFPGFLQVAARHGLDPTRQAVPVVPAAHFHMGGIAVDIDGRSSVPGLWAVGEVACNGVHGANRLASNSLLEGLVFGTRTGRLLASKRPSAASGNIRYGDAKLPQPPNDELRTLMWQAMGLVREPSQLLQACDLLADTASDDPRGAAAVASAMCQAALRRQHSLGAHYRSDQRRCA